jgi:hypothetical protein
VAPAAATATVDDDEDDQVDVDAGDAEDAEDQNQPTARAWPRRTSLALVAPGPARGAKRKHAGVVATAPVAAAAAAAAAPAAVYAALVALDEPAHRDEWLRAVKLADIDMTVLVRDFLPTRSADECRNRWINYEDPRINHGAWSEAETTLLCSLAEQNPPLAWAEIAKRLNTRRVPWQCVRQYQSKCRTDVGKRKWTEAETKLLLALVARHGLNNWSHVATHLDARTDSNCYSHYHQTLDEKVKKGKWEEEEDVRLLLALEATRDPDETDPLKKWKWKRVHEFMSGRTDTQCRERYACAHTLVLHCATSSRRKYQHPAPLSFTDSQTR